MSRRILAIDPGTRNSGVVLFDPDAGAGPGCRRGKVERAYKAMSNVDVLTYIEQLAGHNPHHLECACEWIEHYGPNIHAGADVFMTCRWIGKFEQACSGEMPFHTVTRREVKLHLCGTMRAKDPNVRKALVDMFGGEKAAKGTKDARGPLYGVASHAWAALGVAVTYADGVHQ